jgi:hypothetical protein
MSLILSGSDGLSDVDGSAATPAIRGTDTNTGIFFPAADTIAFSEGGAEAMRINSAGNLGIGTNNPAQKLSVNGDIYTQTSSGNISLMQGDSTNSGYLAFWNADRTVRSGYVGYATLAGSGAFTISSDISTNAMLFQTAALERMRINSSGSLNINQTASNGATLNITGFNVNYGTAEFSSPKGSNNSHIHFGTFGDWYLRPASNSGSVYVKNYVAESDARLKENIENTPYGLNDILALTPRKFNWIDGGDVENNGFIAQEVEAVIPALVCEGQWKSVDYQGITAIMVKAIQELKTELDRVKDELATLKGAA